jgi:syntaxin 16
LLADLVLKSIESSLAGEMQEVSRSLRGQEQDYFRKIKSYEGSTVNSAIQLTEEQRKSMESEWVDSGLEMEKEAEQQEKGRIGELVGSISRLSALYKELGHLVVAQGTVIDRIDYNLETAEEHIIKGVVHLQGAEEAASSAFADKLIKGLFVAILILAMVLGFKYMK